MRPFTKLKEKNNFKVKWFILCLYEGEISIGRLYSRKVKKKMHMDPCLPHSVVDFVHGALSCRMGIMYLQM